MAPPAAAILMALLISVLPQDGATDDATDHVYYNRAYSSLTEIPGDIPDTVTSIHLCCNYITRVRANAFHNVPVCMNLDLTENRISVIETQAFTGLETLWTLDLGSNDLTELQADVFQGLSHLKTLTLAYNKISRIDPRAFNGLVYLKTLILMENRISTLDGRAFADLPRPLEVTLVGNPLQCDVTLCWLKRDIDNGDIPWFDCNRPVCTDGYVLTNCNVEGKTLIDLLFIISRIAHTASVITLHCLSLLLSTGGGGTPCISTFSLRTPPPPPGMRTFWLIIKNTKPTN